VNVAWSSWGQPYGAWGVDTDTDADEAPVSDVSLTALTTALAPLASGLTDPHQRVAVLEVKLAQARARGASLTTIRTLEAKLAAARRRTEVAVEGEQATRQWRGLGQAAIIEGIGVGVAMMIFLLKKARR